MRYKIFIRLRKYAVLYVLLPVLALIAVPACAQDQDPRDSVVRADTAATEDNVDTAVSFSDATDSVVLRAVPDSAVNKLKNDPAFGYANDPEYWKRDPPREPSPFMIWLAKVLTSDITRIVVYFLLGAALLYALYKIIIGNRLHLFYSRAKKHQGSGIAAAEEIQAEDLDQKIREAVAAGDYRTATRWLFLKSLRVANDHQLIQYHPKLTNYEYVQQMNGRPQRSKFQSLSNAYEHIWYGGFIPGLAQYERLQQQFENFYNSVKG